MGIFDGIRRGRARRGATGPLAELYAAEAHPERRLAVDVETTGLDPDADHLLSIGWVPVDGGEIILGGAGHVVLRRADLDSVGESATVHGITDDVVASGEDPAEAVALVLRALTGRRLLAHFADMELGFLDRACRRHFGAGFDVPADDTMTREYARISAAGRHPGRDELRLWNVRAGYGLPPTRAHHALNDALACAEVWLAQDAHRVPRR
ncbi:exonuclease domain-containing protein [Corynebacterium sphenisci]|uniref:exonuclease domain-containing protein n=1 Tax=Corynebacterium sphenisci TaxID=191493 RepID=UPI0026DF688D|nr:exonuclease domain-containing protein [Corynebacterium sphenisci]MDO5731786.1 exonuclease domain-containing protein [Corynebacterium sphenisci]